MKRKKWNIRRILIIVSCIVVHLISWTISYSLTNKDNLTIQKSYENEKLMRQLLKNVRKNSIREGEGIDIEKIGDNIEYNISSKNNEIAFSYNLKDYKDKYNAKIVLSKNYEIISEDYSVDMISSFEEYKKEYLDNKVVGSFLIGSMVVCIYIYYSTSYFFLQRTISKK